MSSWSLPDASGRNELRFIVVQNAPERHAIEFQIEIEGKFFDRTKIPLGKLRDDYYFRISQILISIQELEDFRVSLDLWMENPSESEFVFQSRADDQRLSFHIEPAEAKSIIPRWRCLIGYGGTALKSASWSFEVDPTCVGSLRDGLRHYLAEENISNASD